MTYRGFHRFVFAVLGTVMALSPLVLVAQSPVITVRLANPQSDCGDQEYCLDVEFLSNMPDQELFGMNIRFFYNDETLELIDFRDFQGGYDAVAPDPPIISTSELAGPALFNFDGPADFVNGAMQLVNTGAPPIMLSTDTWTKLFQICFTVDDQSASNLDTFCPPIVWDLEQDPANGGFLSGDDGVVMTILDPNGQSAPADENVVQFNWEYIGNGEPPYGQPVEIVCSNINCLLPLTWISFTAKRVQQFHVLSWSVVNTSRTTAFQVQASSDGQNWIILERLPYGVAESTMTQHELIHDRPFRGWNYYRIIEEEWDGTFHSSPIIRQYFESAGSELVLYPNPVKDGTLWIRLPEESVEGSLVRISDATGRLALESRVVGETGYIDVADLTPGMYWVSVDRYKDIYRKLIIY